MPRFTSVPRATIMTWWVLWLVGVGCQASHPPVPPAQERASVPTASAPVSPAVQPCVISGPLTVFQPGQLPAHMCPDDLPHCPTVVSFTSLARVSLTLPLRAGGNARVEVSSPIQFRGFLSPYYLPIELRQRLDVEPPHLWLGPGARVYAWAGSNGMAHIGRPAKHSSVFEAEVPCSALALAGATRPPPIRGYLLQSSSALMLTAPQGQILFATESLAPVDVELLETRGDWSHVRGAWSSSVVAPYQAYVPYDFDAWTPAYVVPIDPSNPPAHLRKQPGSSQVALSHRSLRPIALYDGSHVPATVLAPDVLFALGRTFDGFVEPHIPGVLDVAEHDFSIRVEDLKTGTTRN